MEDIVLYLIETFTPLLEAMVDYPDQIQVSGTCTPGKTVLIQVSAHWEDTGKLIGKNGRHVTALNSLISSVGARHRYRVTFEVLDSVGVDEAPASLVNPTTDKVS